MTESGCVLCDKVSRTWDNHWDHATFHANEAQRHAADARMHADKAIRGSKVSIIFGGIAFVLIATVLVLKAFTG